MEHSKPVTSSEYALVNLVATNLNLGDYGKLEGFVKRTAKFLQREIDTIDRNAKTATHNHEAAIIQLNDDLEDAQDGVELVFTNLDPEKLKNNDMQAKFRETYLADISVAMGKVKGVETKIKEAEEKHEKATAKNKEQKDSRQAVITRLTKGVTTKK